jgi:nucleoside-diphosphate kinase
VESTFAILKPDCVEGRHCEDVVRMILDGGFRVLAAKVERLDPKVLTEHYSHHSKKPFFPDLLAYMTRTPVLLMVLGKEDAVSELRKLCGPTDSEEARRTSPDSIRARFGKDKSENVIHASDSDESAAAEKKRFFSQRELENLSGEGLALGEIIGAIGKLYG